MRKIMLNMLFLGLFLIPGMHAHGPETSSSNADLQAVIEGKLDLGNTNIEQTAVTIARDYPGEFSINQVGAIYNSLVEGWSYYLDPNFKESYKNANLTLQDGVRAGTVGAGDCDDFAILIASLIESLGGSTRIIFSQEEETGQGHAYAELYLGKKDDPRQEELENWIKGEFGTSSVPGMRFDDEEVWLNLDYNSSYIGGPFFGGGKAFRKTAWIAGNKTAPKIIPLIDAMDDLSGWSAIKDEIGSNISMKLVPSRKGRAIELEYDLKKNGWAGIAKDIDRDILTELKGINLSYFSNKGQINFEIRLEDEDGTDFSSSIPIQKNRPQWAYLEVLFEDLKKIDLNATGSSDNKMDPARISKLEFIVHSSPNKNGTSGQGIITLDQIRGIMQVPKDSPWARAEDQRETARAKDLASESERARSSPSRLIESAKLAVESLNHHETLEGDLALRRELALLPRQRALMKLNNDVISMAFSPDGTRIAAASKDDTAKIWNAFTGRELARLNHDDEVVSVAFGPDGTRIATASKDNTARIWDTFTGKELARLNHDDEVVSVAFSPDGTRIATASKDNTARIWDTFTGKELARLNHDDEVVSVAFSPNGKRIATANWYRTVSLWNSSSYEELAKLENDGSIECIAFSPDSTKIATANGDNTGRIWNASSGKELVMLQHDSIVTSSNFIMVYEGSVNSIVFSPDGTKIATAGGDRSARIWDTSSGNELTRMMHDSGVLSISFSPDGSSVATASKDDTVRIWDASTSNGLAREIFGDVSAVAFSPDGTRIAATSFWDKSSCIWNISTEEELFRIKHTDWVNSVAFSPDGTRIVVAVSDGTAVILDASTGKELSKLEHNSSINSAVFSPEGTRIATASSDGTARIWDATSGKELVRLVHGNNVDSLAFSPDGSRIATASYYGKTSWVWDAKTGSKLAILEFDSAVWDIAFSPDGTRIAIANEDDIARVWDASYSNELTRIKHEGDVYSVAFSPDGTKVATCGEDNTARVWNSSSGEELKRLEHDNYVSSLAFSPDGTKIVTGSYNGIVSVWLLPPQQLICEACSRLGCNLTTEEWQEQYCRGCQEKS
jgi:WD40 repeat protein